jgi:DNA phosphorothioation-associated putative methyltransferase
MHPQAYRSLLESIKFGKKLPDAIYIARPSEGDIASPLFDLVRRGEVAAKPDPKWTLIKFHKNQVALTFLSYPAFDADPHPPLVESTKINLNTGSIVQTDYRRRSNPPILHRKETFLPPSDKRLGFFSALTRAEEEAGLYRTRNQIGLRVQWLTLLKRLGLTHEGHGLIKQRKTELPAALPVGQNEELPIARHRTAIKRYDLSKPVKQLLQRDLLRKNDTFFDYGCGHGMDIEALQSLGYRATGWDPAFRPDALKTAATVVNLGYVLNVIESPAERLHALREAYGLAERLLLVSTLVRGQETDSHSRPYGDGFLTKTNTFQKFYEPGEVETLIEEALDAEASTLGLGVCVVFRDADEAESFEAGKNRRRIDWNNISSQLRFSISTERERRQVDRYGLHKELFDAFWHVLLELGRAPEVGEFDRLDEVRRLSGGLNRAVALVTSHNGDLTWQQVRLSRSEDVLVYLAMTNFRKPFLRREIPLRIKNDIRAFFGDLETAQAKARDLLFAAGDSGEIELAVDQLDYGVFDREEMHFTFHRTLLERLPPILRVYVHCGAIRYGNPEAADLIKIHVNSGKLTFLQYDDFQKKRNPVLLTRTKINLRTQFVQVFDHSDSRQKLKLKARFTLTPASVE